MKVEPIVFAYGGYMGSERKKKKEKEKLQDFWPGLKSRKVLLKMEAIIACLCMHINRSQGRRHKIQTQKQIDG